MTNVYVVKARITPLKSGTKAKPKPIATSLAWDVSSAPPGQRPANDRGYKISYEGVHENTTFFRGCGTSKLSGPTASPNKCPKGSKIGSGFLILEIGPTGQSNSSTTASAALR